MKQYIIEGIERDESRAIVDAMAAITRLDESKRHITLTSGVYLPGARRREATSIAMIEGAMPQQDNLCRIIGDRNSTNIDRGSKTAADIYFALEKMEKLSKAKLDTSEIVDIFITADASSGRLMRPDVQWSIEEDSIWLSELLSLFDETPDPWTAIETVRTIWTSGRFLGTTRRMALIFASRLLSFGFGGAGPIYGISDYVRKNQDSFRDNANDQNEWCIKLANAISFGFKHEYTKLNDALAERTSLLALCPPVRSSSSIDEAIEFIFNFPIFSAKQFSDCLKLTPRGSKVVLDKMLDANVIIADDASRNRMYSCRRVI